MEDFTNVRLSAYAGEVAERFKERGLFDYEYDAAKFAMGYVIKNYYAPLREKVQYFTPLRNKPNE